MNKLIGLVMLMIIIQGCTQNVNDNAKLINQIDSINNYKTIYELQIDSLGAIIDTLSIQKKKENKNGKLVFKENILFRKQGTLSSINYYRDNETLFYSKFESSEYGIMSLFEAWYKNNEIEKALSVEYDDNKAKDTIEISYKHLYHPNKTKNKTIITSKYKDENKIGNITELFYNDAEKLTSEISILYGDTLTVSKYTYSKKLLKKKTIKDYKKGVFVNLDYDEKGYILREEVLVKQTDSLLKISETQFKTNEKGEIISSTETQFPSNNKKYIKFKYN